MNDIIFLGLNLLVNMNIIVNIVKQTFLKLSDKKLPLNSTIIMDLNQRPQRKKKKLPLRFQNPSEIINSKRSAKNQNMESDNKPEEKKI